MTSQTSLSNLDNNPVNPSSKSAQAFEIFKAENFIVGLTGGIGSGKTMVSNWFAEKEISVVDADVVAHQIMQKGSTTLELLVNTFGDWVLDDNGKMDRRAVREYVFANDNALLKLEEITHPAIRQEIKKQLLSATSPYVILSAPLLLESAEAGLLSLCDRVLVVDVDENIQLSRASQRDSQNVTQIKAVMANQLSRQERLSFANDVIDNNGSLEELYEQLAKLHQRYLEISQDSSN